MIKEFHLFKVTNNSLVYPVFYVEAVDILEATRISKEIVDGLNNDRVIGIVQATDTLLLRWEEDK